LKVLITTIPFGVKDQKPLNLLKEVGVEYLINPLNKKLNEDELVDLIGDYDIVLAGTEPYTKRVIDNAPNLKLISRLGIGLDGVDLNAAKEKGIKISYTPDAPAPSIAELTLGHIITLLRSVHTSNIQMHNGQWNRYLGKTISESTIGFIGVGRIGARVVEMLQAFGNPRILVNDISPNENLNKRFNIEWVDKETIYKEADVISLHVPLTAETKNMISSAQLKMMKLDASLINTCRGGIINEDDLYNVMKSGHLNGVAIDVFNSEPYLGKLTELDKCLLTPHMGSMSAACRIKMELEATEEAVRFIKGMPLKGQVPDVEYDIQLKK
jgi:D-3-phosphoglycerate dehydrogenase / 2-oxoglutarate reductase